MSGAAGEVCSVEWGRGCFEETKRGAPALERFTDVHAPKMRGAMSPTTSQTTTPAAGMSRSSSLFVVGGQATVERAGEARAAVMAGAAMVEVEDSLVAAALVEVEDSVVAAAMVEVEDSVVAALVAARVKWYISTAISTAVLVPGDSATVVRASESSD